MKKILFVVFAALSLTLVSCEEKAPSTVELPIQLMCDGAPFAEAGIMVTLSSESASFESTSSAEGLVTFTVPVGTYTATSSFRRNADAILTNYNGSVSIAIPTLSKGQALATYLLPLTASKSSQLIIKEVYNGGCKDNSGSKNYNNDKYLIVYNNSDTEVDASKMCVAMAQVANTNTATGNKYAIENGIIEYETAGWTPAAYAIWWFQAGTSVIIPPYSQIVIAINGAVDHTATYTNSVDLSKADYCMYDIESGFKLAASYPAPAAGIPASHYMKTYLYATKTTTAWPFPIKTAAPFIIMPDTDIQAFVMDEANFDDRSTNKSGNYAKVPTSWVLDALDIWSAADESKFFGRFPTTVNVGYEVFETNALGYTFYRNVDKAATEAIAENAGKLVYDYAGAVSAEDNDPSGIDAEASIAKGAKIVYMDTNNSATDFHLRKVASIKK